MHYRFWRLLDSCLAAKEGLINNLWGYKDQSQVKKDYLKQRDTKMIADFDDKGRVINVKPADMETN